MAVPAWKQAILNKKREKEEEEERARRQEEEKLAKLPQWKRDLLIRKQASEDRGSPPLNRAAFNKQKRGSLTKKTLPTEKHTLAAGRERVGSDASDKETAPTGEVKAAAPPTVTVEPSVASKAEPRSPPHRDPAVSLATEESTSVDDVDGARPSVRHLLGLFGAGRPRSGSSDTEGGLEARSGSVGERTRRATPAPNTFKSSNEATTAQQSTSSAQSGPSKSSGEMESEEEECTLIDDVVTDELPSALGKIAVTPPRKPGIQSAPVSPTSTLERKGRTERRPSCLAATDKPRKMRRSVSFNELKIETVHHYERVSSPEESDEESPGKSPLPSILKPIKSTPAISSSSSSSDTGGFQSFQPKVLTDDTDSAIPSWRTQVTPVKAKPTIEEQPKEELPEEPDEEEGNTSALLW